jgi:hypothetical protein
MLRDHEETLVGFMIGHGLERRSARALANTLCRFDEICDALEELADEAHDMAVKRGKPVNPHLD